MSLLAMHFEGGSNLDILDQQGGAVAATPGAGSTPAFNGYSANPFWPNHDGEAFLDANGPMADPLLNPPFTGSNGFSQDLQPQALDIAGQPQPIFGMAGVGQQAHVHQPLQPALGPQSQQEILAEYMVQLPPPLQEEKAQPHQVPQPPAPYQPQALPGAGAVPKPNLSVLVQLLQPEAIGLMRDALGHAAVGDPADWFQQQFQAMWQGNGDPRFQQTLTAVLQMLAGFQGQGQQGLVAAAPADVHPGFQVLSPPQLQQQGAGKRGSSYGPERRTKATKGTKGTGAPYTKPIAREDYKTDEEFESAKKAMSTPRSALGIFQCKDANGPNKKLKPRKKGAYGKKTNKGKKAKKAKRTEEQTDADTSAAESDCSEAEQIPRMEFQLLTGANFVSDEELEKWEKELASSSASSSSSGGQLFS